MKCFLAFILCMNKNKTTSTLKKIQLLATLLQICQLSSWIVAPLANDMIVYSASFEKMTNTLKKAIFKCLFIAMFLTNKCSVESVCKGILMFRWVIAHLT